MTVIRAVPVPASGDDVPLGAALLPGSGFGVDLAAAGYVEEEYLVDGTATPWTYDDGGQPVPAGDELAYTTRVLIRRPADPSRFNGVLQAEPLHPEYDTALTWRSLYPWILRTGAAWVGVTQDPRIAASMREEFDPERYGRLCIPSDTMRYDVVADVVSALRTGAAGLWSGRPRIERAYLSGWSMTGSFCRVFLGEGFHERRRLPTGAPLFDGYVIAISSGGAARAGYPGLTGDPDRPGPDDPRRTVGGHDVPVIELLSELETETHEPVLRADSDEPGDSYRLYQVAGTSHDTTGPATVLPNGEQYRRRALLTARVEIVERPSEARLDIVARGVFALLDRWVAEGVPPPRVPRFEFAAPSPEAPADAVALARDELGNVTGGIRTPWVEAPAGRYVPHSSPVPGACRPSPWMPTIDPESMAAMRGHVVPFAPDLLESLHGTRSRYLAAYATACGQLVRQGFLHWEDVEALMATAQQHWTAFPH
jgi:hypothetical protein